MLNIFITGTDINVGKTFISAGLSATMQSLGYSTCVYKPVQTNALGDGFLQSPDLAYVRNIDPYVKTYSSYLFKSSASPIVAAEFENVTIEKTVLKTDYELITKDHDCIITESVDGIMTPLAPDFLTSDMAKLLDLPILIITKPTPAMVNHTLLTINYAEQKGLKIRGVIINNLPENTDINIKTAPRLIEEYSNAKVLGIIKSFPDIKSINPNDLITETLNGIDIESVFDVKIAKLDVN